MKKRNGFTLIELLAVIVVLAIILVIAVPKVLETIDNAKMGAVQSSAKLIASQAETQYLVNQTTGKDNPATVTCGELVSVTTADFDTSSTSNCNVTINTSTGAATVTVLVGKAGGKFAGYKCFNTTKDTATCCKTTGTNCPTS